MTEMNASMLANATATMTENSNEEQTVKYDLVEKLAGKMSISLEDAKHTLEAADWNMLTATHMLEKEDFLRKQALNDVAASCVDDGGATQDTAAEKASTVGKTSQYITTAREKTGAKHKKFFSNLRDHLHRLLAFGNHSRFTIIKDGEQLLAMPVTALALLLLFSFGTCAALMVVGLFSGCRYNITAAAEA